MKIRVLTNKKGDILGTARSASPDVHVSFTPDEGETVHELEVPDHLAELKSDALHRKLGEYLPKP